MSEIQDHKVVSKQIIVDGLLASYSVAEIANSEKLSVLFLHGWASSKEVWGNAMINLSQFGHDVYSLDLPGFGKTQSPTNPWSTNDYAEFVCHFLQKLNLNNIVLIGHSFGGRVALVLAANQKISIKKLVLVDSAGFYTGSGIKKFMAYASKLVHPLFRLPSLRPARKKIYRIFGAEDYVSTPELNDTFVKVISEDLGYLLPKITTKTLIVWGSLDVATPISFAKEFNKKIISSKLIILPKAGHYSFLDKPDEFNKILAEFV